MNESSKKQFTFEDFSTISSTGAPVWHPTKNILYFISNKEEYFQIYQLDINQSSIATKLIKTNDRTTVPMISNKSILCFLSDHGGDENWQIFTYDLEANKQTQLTDLIDRKHQMHFVTNSQIIFSANREDKKRFDIFSYSFVTKKIDLLLRSQVKGLLSAKSLTENESKLLLAERISINKELFYIFDIKSQKLELLDVCNDGYWKDGLFLDSNSILCLTNKDREFASLAIIDIEKNDFAYLEPEFWDTEYFIYDKKAGSIAWVKNVDGYSKLFYGKLENKNIVNKIEIKLPDKSVISAGDLRSYFNPLAFNHDAKKLAVCLDSSTMNQNIWIVELQENQSLKIKNITNIESSKIDKTIFVSETLYKIKSFDNLEFSSYVLLPHGSGDKKVPCVIMIHGGPESQVKPDFNPLVQFFIYNGFAVALPNVRGSTGYGKSFNTLDNIELRLNSVKDINALANYLHSIPEIDTNKLVVYGVSYGGYMVLACVSEYPELFSAGIDIVGISNFVTFLENTATWRRKIREVEYGSLEKDKVFLESVSPIKKANRIKNPLLIVHGKNDERVPLSETIQMHETLKKNNIPVELLVFEDEGHGVVKTKNKTVLYQKIIEFLETYVR